MRTGDQRGPARGVLGAGGIEELAEVRALVRTESLLEERLIEAVHRARAAGIDSVTLAGALGIGRATLYRRFPVHGATS